MSRIVGWLACAGAIALLVVALATGTAPANAAPAAVRVVDAWIRLPAVPGRPAAGYFTLHATAPAVLAKVTAPGARVELHGMSMAGGIMRMAPLPSVAIAAGATVRFAPGGRHLMLFGLAGMRPGTMLPLTFIFADGSVVRVAAVVHAAGDEMPGMPM